MRSRRGITTVEVLVAIVLTAIGVASLLRGLGELSAAQAKTLDREALQRLAESKLDELQATQEYLSSSEGDFADQGRTGYEWTTELQQTGIEGLEYLRVEVTKQGSTLEGAAGRLIYTQPATQDTGGATP